MYLPYLQFGDKFMRQLTAMVLCLLLLAGCAYQPEKPEEVPSDQIVFMDDLSREVSAACPQRVAALIGSFADIWCLAGGRESLVAAANDAWTSFDLGLDQQVADLGAIKEPNLEVLLAAEPDLVLASCNTAANLELRGTLERLGIPVAYFDIQTFEDYLRMLEICTQLTGCPDHYETYGTAVQEQVEAAVARADGSTPKILCLRVTGSGCKAKGSVDNVLGEMLADFGCVNLADSDGVLLENLSLEAIIQGDPDYIFAVLQGSDPTDAWAALEKTLLSHPAWERLRAVQTGNFYTMDHRLYNLKPNARWGEAYEALADILYEKTS